VTQSGFSPVNQSDEALALSLFQCFGSEFPSRVDGVFFICIFDLLHQRLFFANDRFGQYRHYFYRAGKALVFAPEVKGVLAAPFVPRRLNLTAVAEYFRFQQLLNDKTFHEDITIFPQASFAWFDLQSGDWSCQQYWDWDQIPERPSIRFEDAVDETGRLLERAVRRSVEGTLRPGVFLSGGLDSRTLVGLVPSRDPAVVTATFGQHNSRDVYYAQQIADAVGSRHFWFDMQNGQWVLEHVDLHLALTEGFHSWVHMHGINMLSTLRQFMDVNLTGWDGGTVMGDPDTIQPIYIDPVNKSAVVEECFARFNQSYTWPGITEASERSLYTSSFAPQLLGRAYDSLAAEFERYWTRYRRDHAAAFFYIDNHCMRLTQQMVTFGRSHFEYRFPYWDYQLIDFLYSLPLSFRADKRLFRHLITQKTPKLARIPYDKQEFLPTVSQPLHDLHALNVRIRRRLKLYPSRPWLYADYENYLRNDLRAWAEELLFAPRTQERGIFDTRYVRSLFDRHLAGQEPLMLGKIAPLMTFEMMMRALFD
jgi:asparagine synthase (glutamine-hydrolysing)